MLTINDDKKKISVKNVIDDVEIQENYDIYIESGKSYYIDSVEITEKYLKISKIDWWGKIKNKNVKKNYLLLAELIGVKLDNYNDSIEFFAKNKYLCIKNNNISKIYKNFHKLKYIKNCNLLLIEIYKKRFKRISIEMCGCYTEICQCTVNNCKKNIIHNTITVYSNIIKDIFLKKVSTFSQDIITNIITRKNSIKNKKLIN